MILKARIVNERDDFILVDKTVRQNALKGLSMRRRIDEDQSENKINSKSSRLSCDFTTT